MIVLMAADAEPEIEHLINRRIRNHRSAKIASIAPWRLGLKMSRKLADDKSTRFKRWTMRWGQGLGG